MTAVPAIDGWFTVDPPALLGSRCIACGLVVFPPTVAYCRRPSCRGRDFEQVPLATTGTVWSYTDAQYRPPPPYIARHDDDEFAPFAIVAVELADTGMIVLGQAADGCGVDDFRVGATAELVVEPLFRTGTDEHLVWKWRPVGVAP